MNVKCKNLGENVYNKKKLAVYSAEPKHYSVDLSINHSFHLDCCYQFFYILSDYNPLFTLHIYIYIYMCVCVCVCMCVCVCVCVCVCA